jgi:long-chain acyl-CoA synthetase
VTEGSARTREPVMSLEAAEGILLAPGAPFEVGTEMVDGRELQVFVQRPRNLRELLANSVGFGDAELAVWDTGVRWTFAEHERLVASVAAALAERHGIGKGSRVAILGANAPEWVLTAWATIALGGVVVAMNGWWTADEIRFGLDLTEPDLLVADEARLARVADDPPTVPTIVMERDFAAYQEHDRTAPLPSTPLDEDEPVVVMFTSGTTGRPKGAISTHRNLISFIMLTFFHGARTAIMYPTPPDAPPLVSLATSPLFHVSGFQSVCLMGPASGSTFVWATGRFDPVKIFRLSKEEHITRWGGITTQVWRLLDHPEFADHDWGQIRACGGGGSTWSPELQRVIREKLPNAQDNFNVGYGLTECGGLCTMATGDMLAADPNTVGRPLPTAEVAIFDDLGERLPDGVDGLVCVRGPMVTPGYWNNPEATAEAFFPDGWLKTGDVGQMRDGELFLASRKRDLIIRGGENIYPVEIENRLDEHPDILEAAVVPVDHRTLGQEVKAVVVPRPGAVLDPEEVRAFVGATLAYYKVPEYVEIRAELLPRNATGKVLKQVLLGEAENTFVED